MMITCMIMIINKKNNNEKNKLKNNNMNKIMMNKLQNNELTDRKLWGFHLCTFPHHQDLVSVIHSMVTLQAEHSASLLIVETG